MDKNLDNHWHL